MRVAKDFFPKVRKLIISREHGQCFRCLLWADGGSIHHRLLKSRGGLGALSNGILLCGSGTTGCHGWVHANPKQSTHRGYMVPSGSVPAECGVWHPGVQGGMFVYLDVDVPEYLVQPYGSLVEVTR